MTKSSVLSIKMTVLAMFIALTGIASSAAAGGNAEAFLLATKSSNLMLEQIELRDQKLTELNFAMANALAPAQYVADATQQMVLATTALDTVSLAGIVDPAVIGPLTAEVARRALVVEAAKTALIPLNAAISAAEKALADAEGNLAAAKAAQATAVADYEEVLMAPFASYTSMMAANVMNDDGPKMETIVSQHANQLATLMSEKIALTDMVLDHCDRNDFDHQICDNYFSFLERGPGIPITFEMLEMSNN